MYPLLLSNSNIATGITVRQRGGGVNGEKFERSDGLTEMEKGGWGAF